MDTIAYFKLLNTLSDSDLLQQKHWALYWKQQGQEDGSTRRIYLVAKYIQRKRGL